MTEEEALVSAREEIANYEQTTREFILEVQREKEKLVHDCAEKRRSCNIDHSCLMDHGSEQWLALKGTIGNAK